MNEFQKGAAVAFQLTLRPLNAIRWRRQNGALPNLQPFSYKYSEVERSISTMGPQSRYRSVISDNLRPAETK